MEIRQARFIHIMPHESVIYNGTIIEMINNNIEYFNIDEHLFIVTNERVYSSFKKYGNVIYEPEILRNLKLLREYASESQNIFMHSNVLTTKQLILINKQILNKIIWCEWGHDLYCNREMPKTMYRKIRRCIGNTIRFMPNLIRRARIKQFYAIGIGFQYDAIEAKRRYGENIKIVMTPYGYKKGSKMQLDNIIANTTIKKGKPLKVMVGHSAYAFLNHIEILNKLRKYKDKDIKISLVLAYGEEEYKKKVLEYAIEIMGKDKLEVIDKVMSHEEYLEYLNTIDICILDYKHQAALGNIYYLLYMGKKLFLNKDGIIKLFATLEGIENYNVDEIDNMEYEQFSKPIANPLYGKQFAEFHIDEENYIRLWQKTIEELK